MTIPEAIEAMRRNIGTLGEAGAMLVLADVWEDHEANVGCQACDGGQVKMRTNTGLIYGTCAVCHGTGYVSNGHSLRAEYLRILAECGKVGCDSEDVLNRGYWGPSTQDPPHTTVPDDLINSCDITMGSHDLIAERLALMDAYAAADQPTRERWARETRALGPVATCERCEGTGLTYVYMGHGDHDQQGCWTCNSTGLVPAQQEVTT
jgi:hypothetical protein